MYTLEELEKKFLEHAEKAEAMHKDLIQSYKENYPNDPLPDQFKEDFNLSKALSVICSEIIKIKENK